MGLFKVLSKFFGVALLITHGSYNQLFLNACELRSAFLKPPKVCVEFLGGFGKASYTLQPDRGLYFGPKTISLPFRNFFSLSRETPFFDSCCALLWPFCLNSSVADPDRFGPDPDSKPDPDSSK